MASGQVIHQRRSAGSVLTLSQRDFSYTERDLSAAGKRTQPAPPLQPTLAARRSLRGSKLSPASSSGFYQNAAARYQTLTQDGLDVGAPNSAAPTGATTTQAPKSTASHGVEPSDAGAPLDGQEGSAEKSRARELELQTNESRLAGHGASVSSNCAPSDDAHDNKQQPQQHGVGPVMGIFFKVWSLVKVTKVRHQQKMRRQNSEDASQFRYISGEQLAAATAAAAAAAAAKSSSGATANTTTASPSGSRASPAVQQHPECFRRAATQPPSGLLDIDRVRRQVTPSPPRATATGPALIDGSPTSAATSSSSSSSVGVALATGAKWGAHVHALSQTRRAKSEAKEQARDKEIDLELARRRRRISALGKQRRATSEDEAEQQAAAAAAVTQFVRRHSQEASWSQQAEHRPAPQVECDAGQVDSEDADEIYTTPNDSAQSVVSGGAACPEAEPELGRQQQEQQQQQNRLQPIIKSLSTNNFAQILKQTSSRSRQLISEAPKNILNNSANGNSKALGVAQPQTGEKRLSGSRFFISSSSSEDSNPPNPTKLAPSSAALQQQRTSVPLELSVHQHHQPQVLAGRSASRPNSLAVPGVQGARHQLNQAQHYLYLNSPLLTPTIQLDSGLQMGALSPPFVPDGAHPAMAVPVQPSCRLVDVSCAKQVGNFKKSPSLYDMPARAAPNYAQVIANRWTRVPKLSSFQPLSPPPPVEPPLTNCRVPNSLSLHDCELSSATKRQRSTWRRQLGTSCTSDENCEPEFRSFNEPDRENGVADGINAEYKLTKVLLEFGSNPKAKDKHGNTALLLSVISENYAALKCLLGHGVDLNETNEADQSALDLVCAKRPSELRLKMLQLLLDNKADMDRARRTDSSRLLDRLIGSHRPPCEDNIPYIDRLLNNGAKLGSATWVAARNKFDIQLRLLDKLCQDGYFLCKRNSIEAAVYRFEYALRRVAELEQQLLLASNETSRHRFAPSDLAAESGINQEEEQQEQQQQLHSISANAIQQIRFRTFLGLSRSERKRKFYKRALDFAHMAILVDSAAYEGYYSKAHVLKDMGQLDESLATVDQTARQIEKSIASAQDELNQLREREESNILDARFSAGLNPGLTNQIELRRIELNKNLESMEEARRFVVKLRNDVVEEKSANLRGST